MKIKERKVSPMAQRNDPRDKHMITATVNVENLVHALMNDVLCDFDSDCVDNVTTVVRSKHAAQSRNTYGMLSYFCAKHADGGQR